MRLRMLGNSYGVGKTLTEQHLQALRLSRKGNQTFLGRKHTLASKLKMIMAHTGKKFSDAHRAKLSEVSKLKIKRRMRDSKGRLIAYENHEPLGASSAHR